MSNETRVALVTGAASGLGRAIALALKGRGFVVFGTSRRPEGESDYPILPLDVRSEESVRAAIEAVRARAGRLDVLVNNVGARLLGAIEETSVEEAQELFESNFFGPHRVTRAALPLLRAAGGGRIVNVSSLTGLNAIPFGGLYSASKFAVEAYSESLRQEVKQFGIEVSVIEPGPVLSKGRPAPQRARAVINAYDGPRERASEAILRGDDTGIDPAGVVKAVLQAVTSPAPRLRYRVGAAATWLPRLKFLFPWSWYEGFLRKRYALDGAPRR